MNLSNDEKLNILAAVRERFIHLPLKERLKSAFDFVQMAMKYEIIKEPAKGKTLAETIVETAFYFFDIHQEDLKLVPDLFPDRVRSG